MNQSKYKLLIVDLQKTYDIDIGYQPIAILVTYDIDIGYQQIEIQKIYDIYVILMDSMKNNYACLSGAHPIICSIRSPQLYVVFVLPNYMQYSVYPIICSIRSTQSLVYYVVINRSLFVSLLIFHLAILLSVLQLSDSDYPFTITKMFVIFRQEEIEDTKGVIRISISKDRQHNSQEKKYKWTNNDLQNIHIKLKIE